MKSLHRLMLRNATQAAYDESFSVFDAINTRHFMALMSDDQFYISGRGDAMDRALAQAQAEVDDIEYSYNG